MFAHPEDEAFGPAGTLAKYASEGVQVSLVTASREMSHALNGGSLYPARFNALPTLEGFVAPRETQCSCRTTGIYRICLLDTAAGALNDEQAAAVEERLVRLIRELAPQVVVTYGPEGRSGDPEHVCISELTTRAYHAAGDPTRYPQHLRDELLPHQPSKLYYNILPTRLLERWGIQGLAGAPEERITTVLNVSPYSAKLKTLYCQRNQVLDYARWLAEDPRVQWDEEYFFLADSTLTRKPRREKDLFAGLR